MGAHDRSISAGDTRREPFHASPLLLLVTKAALATALTGRRLPEFMSVAECGVRWTGSDFLGHYLGPDIKMGRMLAPVPNHLP